MKTLFGLTYAQLNTLTTSEMNEYVALHTVNQVRGNIAEAFPSDDGKEAEKFLAIYLRHVLDLYNSKFDDALYANIRSLYDTEERFNLAAYMTEDMGNIATLVQGMMVKVFEEMTDKM